MMPSLFRKLNILSQLSGLQFNNIVIVIIIIIMIIIIIIIMIIMVQSSGSLNVPPIKGGIKGRTKLRHQGGEDLCRTPIENVVGLNLTFSFYFSNSHFVN